MVDSPQGVVVLVQSVHDGHQTLWTLWEAAHGCPRPGTCSREKRDEKERERGGVRERGIPSHLSNPSESECHALVKVFCVYLHLFWSGQGVAWVFVCGVLGL